MTILEQNEHSPYELSWLTKKMSALCQVFSHFIGMQVSL